MTNPLVEQQPESNDGFITQGSGDAGWATGIGIADSVNEVSSLNEGSTWLDSSLAYGGLAMEAVGAAVDPIGTLLSYGLSWLIEHVQPLKEALDWFAGDPDGVAAYGKTWENVSKAVGEAAEQYNAAVKADTADWTGAAGDAYRKTAAEKGEALAGAAQLAGTISSVVTIMGEVVSFVREFVRDLVADCVSRLITYALEAVLPPIASLAWVIPQAVAFISKTVTKIVDIVTKLTKTISNVSPKLAKLAEVFGDIMKTLSNTVGPVAKKVAGKLDVAERLAEKTWKKVDDAFGTDVVGRRNARMGGPDTPDGTDAGGDSGAGGGSVSHGGDSGAPGSSSQSGSPSARSESVADSGVPRSEPDPGGSSSGGHSAAEPVSGDARTDAGPGSQQGTDPGQSSGGSSRTDTDPSSGSGGSANSDSGSPGRTDSSSDSGSGTQLRTDSSPDAGGQPRTEPGSSSAGPHGDSGSGGQSHSSGSNAGGSSTHTSDVPREPAHTTAAGVEAPARPPETASPQPAPAAPRQDQPSGPAPAGGANAPASPSAPGGGTPSPRGGRQGGWTGSSGHPGAARDLPSHSPRPPRSPSSPPGPRPNGPGFAHPHAPRGGSPAPRQAPHAPAPMRSARPDAPHTPARHGTPVQRQQVAPPRPEQLRTADAPRTPIPAQRTPETSKGLPEQPELDQPKVSTAESMAAETPPKDQWQDRHHMADHTPRLNISPELRDKLGPFRRDIEATGAGLSFTKPQVSQYFGRAEWAHKRPQCSVDPNRFTVEMHGSPNGVKFKHIELDAKELAEIIRGTSGYKEGTPIRLVSCETGADVPDGSKNFAQQLSEELGVEVLAPNTNAWVDNYGNIYANESSAKFDKDESGAPKPRLDSPGEWTAFRPDGTKAVHSSPYPPGHQPEWVRHGIQAEKAAPRGLFGRRKNDDFSIDPVTGHNFSNAPPHGHFGPPQGNSYPQQPQDFQQAPNQGFAQQPQHHGHPQQGYGPQAYPQQGYLQPGPTQPHPQPQPSAPPHYANQPHQGYQQPSSPQGYPQHSTPQNHPQPSSGGYPQQPRHVSQQVGHSPHPQPPQQGAYAPPQHPQSGYVPPHQPAHAQPRPGSPQQQGFPPQGGRPNAFPSSNSAQSWHGAQNTTAPVQGGYGPGVQPQHSHGHTPNAAAPNSNPATPGAPGHAQTRWDNATPQRPSAPQQPAAPNPRLQPPGPPTGHQPAVPQVGGASRQPDGVGSAAPNGPTAAAMPPSKPVLDDFTPAQPGPPHTADAPVRSYEDFLRDNGFEQGALVPDVPNTGAPELGDRNPLDEFDFFGDKDFRATADDHSALRQLGKVLSEAEIQEIRGRRPDIEHITDEELSAMYLYTGMDHQYWNEALRNGDVEDVRRYETVIRNAVSGMNKLPDWTSTPELPTVHRGIHIDSWDMDDFLERYASGEVVTENAFTSSSKSDPFPGNVEFVIEAREGKDLEFLKPFGGMSEVAWPPGNRFQVDRREYNDETGKWIIHLTDLGR